MREAANDERPRRLRYAVDSKSRAVLAIAIRVRSGRPARVWLQPPLNDMPDMGNAQIVRAKIGTGGRDAAGASSEQCKNCAGSRVCVGGRPGEPGVNPGVDRAPGPGPRQMENQGAPGPRRRAPGPGRPNIILNHLLQILCLAAVWPNASRHDPVASYVVWAAGRCGVCLPRV